MNEGLICIYKEKYTRKEALTFWKYHTTKNMEERKAIFYNEKINQSLFCEQNLFINCDGVNISEITIKDIIFSMEYIKLKKGYINFISLNLETKTPGFELSYTFYESNIFIHNLNPVKMGQLMYDFLKKRKMMPLQTEKERKENNEDSNDYFQVNVKYKCTRKGTVKEKINYMKETLLMAEEVAEKEMIKEILKSK